MASEANGLPMCGGEAGVTSTIPFSILVVNMGLLQLLLLVVVIMS